MKIKLGLVLQASETVTTIINQNRALSQKGAYRIARMYAKLKPEYDLIAARRNAMIEAYGHHAMVPPPKTKEDPLGQGAFVPAEGFSVPLDKMPEFVKAWADVAAEEIEIEIEPLPLDQLCPAGSEIAVVSAAELIALDSLVRE